MFDLFNKNPIDRPAGIKTEYTTNSNIDWIIAGLKCLCDVYNTICNICRWILERVICQHKITTFLRLDMTCGFWARHKTFWTLSPSIPQFKVFRGSRCFVQTLRCLFSPAAIESPIIIVLKRFFIKLEHCWGWKFNQFVFENLIEGTVVIMV